MWFVTLVFRNLDRRRIRTLLTIIAAGVAIGTVVAMIGTVNKFQDDFLKIYGNWDVDLVVLRAGAGGSGLQSLLPEDVQKEIEKIPHVRAVTPILLDLINFPETELFVVPLSGRAPDTVTLNKVSIVPTVPPGRELKADDKKCILLGRLLASQLDKTIGDTVTIYEETFTVIGLFESSSPLENGGAAILISELQRLRLIAGKVTAFLVSVENADTLATTSSYIEQVRAAVAQITISEQGEGFKMKAESAHDSVINMPGMKMTNSLVLLISGISLIVGSIGMINTMLMSVFERTREIGILRALGWRKSRILLMILMESWFICLSGAIVGVVGAYAVVGLLGRYLLPTIGNIAAGLPEFVWVQSVLVALLLGFLGGFYPAIRAAQLPPTEAVRHE